MVDAAPPSKSQSLVERLRTEATETNIEGFELSPCWTPELLTEAADEIERLTRELKVQNAVNELAYIPARNLAESRDNAVRERDRLHAALCHIANECEWHRWATVAREALAPKPMMSADGGEDIPL